MKTIYLMTRLAWKVFISSKPCRLIVILLQGFVQHMFDKLLFLLTPLKIAISYKVKKNSTKWNSRAGARLRQQTFSLGAKCASPGGLLYDREVRRTFLSYEKEFHKVEFSRRARLPNGNIFHARECASPGGLFVG